MTSLLQIRCCAINLPNLDQRVADWITSGVENPSTQMGDLPDGWSDRIANNNQIVVSIERELVWIEWSRVISGVLRISSSAKRPDTVK